MKIKKFNENGGTTARFGKYYYVLARPKYGGWYDITGKGLFSKNVFVPCVINQNQLLIPGDKGKYNPNHFEIDTESNYIFDLKDDVKNFNL